MLDNYEQQKQTIVDVYDKIVSLGILPIGDISNIDIEEQKSKLKENHFVVSVAGQIKSGKSTMLNALIFGNEILPADDSPHTAKITEITYADSSHFVAIFYSDDEWNSLKTMPLKLHDGKESPGGYFKQYIQDKVDISNQNGLYDSEVIGSSDKRVNDLGKLKEYVANGGLYTPFVKSITIGFENEVLKNITIVDTPGINDPDKFRSKMTEEWIHKSDAVIYATYAGQALSKSDISFIDKYLIHVPASKRIVVVNKIDLEDRDAVERWIDELRSNKQFSQRIFNDDTTFVYASTLGALIDVMDKNGIEINDNLMEYAKELESKGYLNHDKYGLKEIMKAIDDKLISNKVDNIISGHKKFILSLFERRILSIEKDIGSNKSHLNTVLTDDEDLKQKLKNLTKAQKEMGKLFDEFKIQLAEDQRSLANSLEDDINKTKHLMEENIRYELKIIGRIKSFQYDAQWIIKREIERELSNLRNKAKEYEDKFNRDLEDSLDSLQENIERYQAFDAGQVKGMIFFSTKVSSYKIRDAIGSSFESENANHIVENSTKWFQRWFNTSAGRDVAVSALTSEASNVLQKELSEGIIHRVRDAVKNGSDTIRKNTEDEVNMALDKMVKDIKSIEESSFSKEEQVKSLKSAISNLEKEKSDMQSLINNIKDQLDGQR